MNKYPDIYDVLEHEMRESDMRYEQWLATRPYCIECDTRITEDECYEFDGEYICIDCMEEHHKIEVRGIEP